MMYQPSRTTRADIRERPSMYIGSTGPAGITNMALEVFENSVDLVLGGRANKIEVMSYEDGSVEIRDNGPGLDLSDEHVRSFFEVGHDNATADGHQPHIHLWEVGLGLFAINALSERLTVESAHEGIQRLHQWSEGGETHLRLRAAQAADSESFTSIRFWPDSAIFGTAELRAETLMKRLVEIDRLLPELEKLSFTHALSSSDDGLRTMMSDRLRLGTGGIWRHSASVVGSEGTPIDVDLGLAASGRLRRMPEQMLLFCNYREVTEESGVHRAIRSALGALESEPLGGLAVACNLRMLSPQFSGPTRGRVDDPAAMEAVKRATTELLDAHPAASLAVAELLSTERRAE